MNKLQLKAKIVLKPRTPTAAKKKWSINQFLEHPATFLLYYLNKLVLTDLMLHIVINITIIIIACQEFHHLHLMDTNQGV
jgi:hypothetical protein